MKKGKLFVIESGTDGSGKATQTNLLYERLSSEGFNVRKIEYPNYKGESSAIVKMYLRGDFGERADDVDPYIASTFFAVDRYASYMTEWRDFIEKGGIVIADRYTTSNMVHQASKMESISEIDRYLDWLDEYEYNMYGLPRPTEVFFLDVPLSVSADLMRDRNNKFTHEKKKDIHESDMEYLSRTYTNSLYVAEKYGWKKIDCVFLKDGKLSMDSVENIHERIYQSVKSIL